MFYSQESLCFKCPLGPLNYEGGALGASPNLLVGDAARMLCRVFREEHGDLLPFKTSKFVFPKNTAISQRLKCRTSFVPF